MKKFIEKVMKPRWIVNVNDELGIRILGINFWYYKWPDPIINGTDEYATWRIADKREFGEVIHSNYGFNRNK
jgi:hypothetical protein